MRVFSKILLSLFAIAFVGCKSKGYYDNATTLKFADNIRDTTAARTVCVLDESKDPLAPISDFAMINDTSFVVVDKHSVAIFNTRGERISKPFLRGRGKGEIISPSSVCVSAKYIYVWCSSLMKVIAITPDGRLHAEYTGFERAVRKMTVDDDRHLYMYTSGEANDAANEFKETVRVYDLAEKKAVDSFGVRFNEDEVMFITANSGGIDCHDGYLLYANPGTPRLLVRDVDTNKETIFQIEDPEFNMEKVEHSRDITGNIRDWVAFAQKNAVIRGVYSSGGKTFMVAETGAYDTEAGTVGTRKIKVYEFGADYAPLRSVVYDKFNVVSGFDVLDSTLLLLCSITENGSDGKPVQRTYLKSFRM